MKTQLLSLSTMVRSAVDFPKALLLLLSLAAAGAAIAQTVADTSAPEAQRLDIPEGLTLFTAPNPNLRKATAVVNGEIITGTDVDHRLALIVSANEGKIPAEELQRLRLQVLRNLIDETLQVQEAKANEIEVTAAEIDENFNRVARQNFRQGNVAEFNRYLTSIGASPATLRRQIEGELAWSRLLRRRISPFVNASEDEVNAIIARLNAQKGSTEYRLGEIFLSATSENEAEVTANARRIMEQLRGGASFVAYARQFSEASTAAVGGDLGWISLAQLPPTLASEAAQLDVGQLVGPVPAPGGMSILYMIDKRQVLTADPRDAVLTLKQVAISFPAEMTEAKLEPIVRRFTEATSKIAGCGQADEVGRTLNAEVVSRDGIRLGDLPGPLQQVLSALPVGQSTPPYGSREEGVRVFVLCGRDDPKVTSGPSFDEVMSQLEDERVNRRARIYLRDLRRDAVIEYN